MFHSFRHFEGCPIWALRATRNRDVLFTGWKSFNYIELRQMTVIEAQSKCSIVISLVLKKILFFVGGGRGIKVLHLINIETKLNLWSWITAVTFSWISELTSNIIQRTIPLFTDHIPRIFANLNKYSTQEWYWKPAFLICANVKIVSQP